MSYVRKLQQFAHNNSPELLTGAAIIGTVGTAYLTGRATLRCAHVLGDEELTPREKFDYSWKDYAPAFGLGSLTVGAILMGHKVSSKRTAAMVAAYGLSERAFTEYKEKVLERLGEKDEQAIRDEMAQERVNVDPPKQVIVTGGGDVLCYDSITGRYFNSSVEKIKKAQNDINHRIINHNYESLSAFYDEIGLPATSYSDEVGWNADNLIDISFSATVAEDGKPCLVMDFTVQPIHNYGKMW